MNKLNNKGYMLVEIILASALAFGLAYFILDLTIKMKNKNDDLLVETQVVTDKTIITNKLMEYAISEGERFNCDNIDKVDKKIIYKNAKGIEDTITYVNEYADIGEIVCNNSYGKISISIPLEVKQMKNKDYDVVIDYKYEIDDRVAPTCELSFSGSNTTVTFDDKASGVNVEKTRSENTSWDFTSDSNKATLSIPNDGKFIVYDMSGNQKKCSFDITKKDVKKCPSGYSDSGSRCYKINGYNCTCICCPRTGGYTTTWTENTLDSSSSCSKCGSVCWNSGGDWYDNNSSPSYSYADYNYSCRNGYSSISGNNSYCYKITNQS